ncbi:MAG: hypothetical protein MUF42_00705 [Cytophagaceae bacterium]|nr:hypothetical protein [Cytophagaceae bacterium]
MRLRVLLILTVFSHAILHAQVPFASFSQLPVLQNPSFAGSKNQKRISLAGTTSQTNDYSCSGLFASYDDFFPRLKLGIALHYLYHQQSNTLPYDSLAFYQSALNTDEFTAAYPSGLRSHTFGLSLAPKFNLGTINARGAFSRNFSPSLEIAMGHQRENDIGNFDYNIGNYIYPDTVVQAPDTLYGAASNVSGLHWHAGLGMKLNSRNWILHYLFTYGQEGLSEYYFRYANSINRDNLQMLEKHLYNRVSFWTQRIGASYAINENNKIWNVTFHSVMAWKKYIGANNYIGNERSPSLSLLRRSSMNTMLFLNGAVIIRLKSILGGFSYTRYNTMGIYGINVGFQQKRFRILATFFPTDEVASGIRTGEVCMSLFFKQGKK